jgi:hypothetical protein
LIRKLVAYCEEIRSEGGRDDGLGPLRKVACLGVVANPYAGRWSQDLGELVELSGGLATALAERALEVLGGPVESYGKGAIVGLRGEQEHANACMTSVFGDAFRRAIGGGEAWLPSVTKRGPAGTSIDIPICYKDEIWVRSHYDSITVCIPDAPLEDELVVVLGVANRGRINARLGGLTKEQAAAR